MREKYLDYLRSEITNKCELLSWHEEHGSLTQMVAFNKAHQLIGVIETGYAMELIGSDEYYSFRGVVDNIWEEALRTAIDIEGRRK